MTKEYAKNFLYAIAEDLGTTGIEYYTCKDGDRMREAIKTLEWNPCRDMEEINNIMECDADIETKYKMISNILTAKPHYFEKQESVLNKIRTKIAKRTIEQGFEDDEWSISYNELMKIIDKAERGK